MFSPRHISLRVCRRTVEPLTPCRFLSCLVSFFFSFPFFFGLLMSSDVIVDSSLEPSMSLDSLALETQIGLSLEGLVCRSNKSSLYPHQANNTAMLPAGGAFFVYIVLQPA